LVTNMLNMKKADIASESGQGPLKDGCLVTVVKPWLTWLESRGYSPATITVRKESLRRFTEFCDSIGKGRCQDITAKDIEQWRLRMFEAGNTTATVEQRLRSVRLLFKWLDERGLLFENPTHGLTLHRTPSKLPVVPTVGEVFRLLAGIDTSIPVGIRDRAIIETVYGGGLRLGEVTALTADDFDWDSGLLLVNGKGSKQRSVPVGKRAVRWVRHYLTDARPALLGRKDDPGCLWMSTRGETLSSQGISVRIRHWIRLAGLPKKYTPHALRRAAASHMLDNGASPFAIKEFLGHADMKHLSQYLRVTITELKQMHQASRIGE